MSAVEVRDDVFALSGGDISYVFRVTPEGLLKHLYFGARLSEPLGLPIRNARVERACSVDWRGVPHLSLNTLPQEYGVAGTSDFRAPALRLADGRIAQPLYTGHRIEADVPDRAGLPGPRGDGATTLTVELEDAVIGLRVELRYTVWDDASAIDRSARMVNMGSEALRLDTVMSGGFDLPAERYDVLHLSGSWAREMEAERIAMPKGRFLADSSRGTSSNAHNPFLVVLDSDATETAGRVWGTALVYSGNHRMSVETGEFGDLRVMAGINPEGFAWRLEPGESFTTPDMVCVFSDAGLGEMSHRFHHFVRTHILPGRFRDMPRPTYLNTWEAAYFDVSEDKVLALADTAVEVGVEMLVLDDGWFEGREDDTSSLGDWTADAARFPNGIPALAAKVKAKGLKFGLWFEPEMVNPRSDLYAAHPDWVLHQPGREPSLGRNQLTLDLTREEVREYIFGQLDAILSCGDIDYVKWDMNRNMTEVGSASLSDDRQAEVSHRYMLGLYDLIRRLTEAYPDVLFENCASGGNRMDLGMLCHFSQTWTSDMCDPVGRLSIIEGASLYLPLDCLAAYVGPSPNHQNGRAASLQTRFLAGAFNAARGLSLSESDLNAGRDELRQWMAFAKRTAPDMLGGRFDRLIRTENEVCWQYASRDGAKVWLAYFHILSLPNAPFRRVRLRGLDPGAMYCRKGGQDSYQGDALMAAGLPMPHTSVAQALPDIAYMPIGDFSSVLIELTRV